MVPSVIPFGWNILTKDPNVVGYVVIVIKSSHPNNLTIQNFCFNSYFVVLGKGNGNVIGLVQSILNSSHQRHFAVKSGPIRLDVR